jgi:hypothetical protein
MLWLGTPTLIAILDLLVPTKFSLVVVFGILAVGAVVLIYGTVAKNRWGINLSAVSCPRCKTPLPTVRKPMSRGQRLWGGWTCPACGAEVDKWGREVTPLNVTFR